MARYEIDRSRAKNRLLLALLDIFGFNVTEAAQRIGIDKATLSLALANKKVSDATYKKIAQFFLSMGVERKNGK